MNKAILIAVLLVIVAGCNRQEVMGAHDYIKAVHQNKKINIVKEMNSLKFSCRYKSLDEMVLAETSGSVLKKEKYDEIASKYKDLVYFNFLISMDKNDEIINQRGKDSYFQMLDYFSNKMQGDFFMIVKEDTLPCTAYYYERNFELSPHNNISLAFFAPSLVEAKTNKWKEEATLVYDDKILGTGTLNFKFNKAPINELPILDYEKN